MRTTLSAPSPAAFPNVPWVFEMPQQTKTNVVPFMKKPTRENHSADLCLSACDMSHSAQYFQKR
jgi:hypothetical protein